MSKYLLARLRESSTIRGIIFITGGLLGVTLSDAEATTLIAAANIFAGIIGAVLPDSIQ
jgi:hypothetical protein